MQNTKRNNQPILIPNGQVMSEENIFERKALKRAENRKKKVTADRFHHGERSQNWATSKYFGDICEKLLSDRYALKQLSCFSTDQKSPYQFYANTLRSTNA